MNLFCSCCQQIHSYKPLQLERLIYSLQLAEYDSAVSDKDKQREWFELECLDALLDLGQSSEGYAEAINESLLPARKELSSLR